MKGFCGIHIAGIFAVVVVYVIVVAVTIVVATVELAKCRKQAGRQQSAQPLANAHSYTHTQIIAYLCCQLLVAT